MNKKNFIKIVQQPNNLSEKELKFVEEINKEYPYFQASKAILLKFLKKTEDIKFKKYLRSTAAYTKNREVLFDFINDINDQNEKVYFNKNEIPIPPHNSGEIINRQIEMYPNYQNQV